LLTIDKRHGEVTGSAGETSRDTFGWQQTMAQGIAEALSRDILSGAIQPGDRLRESDLARRFGTSRGPVREALRTLHARRLLAYEANRGAQVTMLSPDDVAQIYEARLLLEGFFSRRHAPRAADLAALDAIVDRMQAHADAGDLSRLVEDDLDFHRYWASRDPNRQLGAIWDQFDVPMGAIFLVMMRRGVVTLDQVPGRHRRIVDAYRTGDPDRIHAMLEAHYHTTTARLRDLDLTDGPPSPEGG
jgi:GntR family transcriptional regulator of gluconate operon